jgi:hypothetical protein
LIWEAEPKTKLKKIGSTVPVKEEEKAKADVVAQPRSEEEEENLGKASPKDISDTHLLPFPRQLKSLWKMKSPVASWR